MTTAEAATSAWQMGNLLRHYGVRPGERVAVVTGPTDPGPDDEPGQFRQSPVPILAILGALVAGGIVDLDPPAATDATALVLPAAWLDRYRSGPGTTAIAYGDDHDDPGVAHLEREAWSENRTRPPVDLDATTEALAADRVVAHGELVTTAHRVETERNLGEGDRVALDAPMSTGGALVAGVLAPLFAGGTVVLGQAGDEVAYVVTEDATASHELDPGTVLGADV